MHFHVINWRLVMKTKCLFKHTVNQYSWDVKQRIPLLSHAPTEKSVVSTTAHLRVFFKARFQYFYTRAANNQHTIFTVFVFMPNNSQYSLFSVSSGWRNPRKQNERKECLKQIELLKGVLKKCKENEMCRVFCLFFFFCSGDMKSL